MKVPTRSKNKNAICPGVCFQHRAVRNIFAKLIPGEKYKEIENELSYFSVDVSV